MVVSDDEKPTYIPIFEIAGAAALFGLLRRLDKATNDVLRLKRTVVILSWWLCALSIVTLINGGLLVWNLTSST